MFHLLIESLNTVWRDQALRLLSLDLPCLVALTLSSTLTLSELELYSPMQISLYWLAVFVLAFTAKLVFYTVEDLTTTRRQTHPSEDDSDDEPG